MSRCQDRFLFIMKTKMNNVIAGTSFNLTSLLLNNCLRFPKVSNRKT